MPSASYVSVKCEPINEFRAATVVICELRIATIQPVCKLRSVS